MKKTAIKLVVVSAFLLLSVGCMEEHERASSSFNSFLNIYGSEIADNYHLYLILPAFSCAGCVQIALQKANSSLSAEHKSYVTIIYQSNLVIPDELGQKAAVFRDSTNRLDHILLKIANPMILTTENKKINEVFYTRSDNVEQVFDSVFVSLLAFTNN
jgi:hypothetical protein